MKRWAWIAATSLALALIAVSWMARSSPFLSRINIYQPVRIEERKDLQSARQVRQLEAVAPPFDRANFGPGTRTASYRVPWGISEAFELSDGTLLITYDTGCQTSGCETYYLGRLLAGRIQPVRLPAPAGTRLIILRFTVASTDRAAIVEGMDVWGRNYLFAVGSHEVGNLPYRNILGRPNITDFTLLDGGMCQKDPSAASPYALWAIGPSGAREPLITKAALRMATSGLITDTSHIDLGCYHFAKQNLVVLAHAEDAITFRLLPGGNLTALTRGKPFFIGRHRMLFWISEISPQGPTGYQDYLEVFAQ